MKVENDANGLDDVGADVFVARQPIFWADQRIIGYELLYRQTAQAEEAGDHTLGGMASSVLVNALLAIGLKDITGGQGTMVLLLTPLART